MVKYLIGLLIAIVLMAFVPSKNRPKPIKPDSLVLEVLEELGVDQSAKKPKNITNANARIGEDLVNRGFSKRDNLKKAKRQSKHFVCTSCHNVKREDPDLLSFDPQARLDYVTEKGLPFLQATTLYGAINREHWYNGDYEKKYGDLVKPARNDIREAVQLCAVECAQGRRVKDWELESIMAYLWEIGLQIKDLDLSEKEVDIINDAILNSTNQATAAALITTKYSKESPATFLLPPDDRSAGSGLEGDPKNGRLIYEGSCLHCHYQKRYTFFPLDRGKMSFTHLSRKIPTYSRQSLYQVVRWGTFSKFGKQSYMPRYTEEKMSVQQLADLRAYIDEQAETL